MYTCTHCTILGDIMRVIQRILHVDPTADNTPSSQWLPKRSSLWRRNACTISTRPTRRKESRGRPERITRPRRDRRRFYIFFFNFFTAFFSELPRLGLHPFSNGTKAVSRLKSISNFSLSTGVVWRVVVIVYTE